MSNRIKVKKTHKKAKKGRVESDFQTEVKTLIHYIMEDRIKDVLSRLKDN